MQPLKDYFVIIATRIQNAVEQMKPTLEQAAKAFDQIKPALEQAAKALKQLPPKVRTVQDYLARRGWYLSVNYALPDIIHLYDLIIKNEDLATESLMIDYAHERVQPTLQRNLEMWPARASIMKDAFQAHENGQYTTSIPLLLIQADGIAHELLGVSMFSSNREKGAIIVPKSKSAYKAKLGKDLDPESTDIFILRPLEILSSIAINTEDRDKERELDPLFGPLNRHAIIHGFDLDYASEANSLRCIVMLDYLADLEEEFSEHITVSFEQQKEVHQLELAPTQNAQPE